MNEWELTDEQIAEIEHDAHDVCRRCEGEGRLWADGQAHYYDANRPTKACPECDGDGRVPSGDEGRAIAKSAVDKFYGWLMESCHEHGQDPHLMMPRVDCQVCMKPFDNALEAAGR